MKSNATPSKAPFRPAIKTVFLILLLVAGAAVLHRGVKYLRRDSVPPILTAVQSPMGPTGRREWSKEVVHYPGFHVPKGDREWSHSEIAQRHRALLLKELPDYVTELRGCGAIKETSGTDAIWLFVVPEEHMREFADYLVGLGIPSDALHEEKDGIVPKEFRDPENHPPAPSVPATALIYSSNFRADGEGEVLGMRFGKSSDTMNYVLINPNITRASAKITLGWKTGNVEVYELPYKPDWEK